MAKVAKLPCCVPTCRASPVTVHHVTGSAHGGRVARSHKRVVPLCPKHHFIQHNSKTSVEALGHRGFCRVHGVDLMAEAQRLWESLN